MKAKTRRTVKRAVPIVMAVIMVLSVIVSALSSAVTAYADDDSESRTSNLANAVRASAYKDITLKASIGAIPGQTVDSFITFSNNGNYSVDIKNVVIEEEATPFSFMPEENEFTVPAKGTYDLNVAVETSSSAPKGTYQELKVGFDIGKSNDDEDSIIDLELVPKTLRNAIRVSDNGAKPSRVADKVLVQSDDSDSGYTEVEGSIAKPRMDIKVASSTPTSCKEGDTIDLIILLTYSKNNVSLQSSSISVTGDNFSVINGMVSRNLQYESYKYKGSENFTKAVRYQLQTKNNLVSGYYPVNIKVEYLDYDETQTYTSENSFNIYIEGTKDEEKPDDTTKVDLPTPQLIVDQYSYASETGNDYIMAGDTFSLNLKIKNTSNIPVVNTVVTLEEGLGFTLTDSSNSIYLDRLGAGETMEQNISVRAKPNTSTPSSQPGDIYTIAVKFNYQYVNDKTYNTVTKDEKLAIPVVQKDRFEVGEPEPPMMMYVGEESSIELTFVNKGTTDVRNITAVISGNIQNDGQSQYIGNLPAGEESSVSFTFNAVEAGMVKAAITLTYEDSNDIQREVVKEFTVEAQEMPKFDDNMGGGEMMDPGMMEPMDEGFKMPIWGWILIGVGGVAVLVVVIVIIRKKRKAKKEQEEDDEDI